MIRSAKEGFWDNFRRFFVRGLAIILPSILTIWILIAAYNFLQTNIASPINDGIREGIIRLSDWPPVADQRIRDFDPSKLPAESLVRSYEESENKDAWIRLHFRRQKLLGLWENYHFPLDLIGLVVAVFLIYVIGGVLGSFLGRRLYHSAERFFGRIPLINRVYPSIKQVTEFLVGDVHGDDSKDSKTKFRRVVAVQYPRKGLWSVGLVTGTTLRNIQDAAGTACVTVFVPSSPTPFTGYVITVPAQDTIELPITTEEALRFTVSGGVLVPTGQQTPPADKLDATASNPSASDTEVS